jgi:hypothetical protein
MRRLGRPPVGLPGRRARGAATFAAISRKGIGLAGRSEQREDGLGFTLKETWNIQYRSFKGPLVKVWVKSRGDVFGQVLPMF